MREHRTRAQQDLFEKRPEDKELGASARAKALEQLQLLLIEATRLAAESLVYL